MFYFVTSSLTVYSTNSVCFFNLKRVWMKLCCFGLVHHIKSHFVYLLVSHFRKIVSAKKGILLMKNVFLNDWLTGKASWFIWIYKILWGNFNFYFTEKWWNTVKKKTLMTSCLTQKLTEKEPSLENGLWQLW